MSLDIKGFFYDDRQIVSAGGATEDIPFIRANEDTPYFVNSVSVKNDTTAALLAGLYIVRSGKLIGLDTITLTIANRHYLFNWTGYLKAPDYLMVRFHSTIASDKLFATLNGIPIELK
jgi:hypothetical protein